MQLLLFISAIILLGYLYYIVLRYGVQRSISQTYYTIGKKWWFTLILWGMAIPIIIVGLEVLDGSPLMFCAGVSICFVGAAPLFKVKKALETKVHLAGSYMGVGLGTLSVIIDFGYWKLGLGYLLFVVLSMIFKYKNFVWWIEVAAYLMLLGTIWSKL